jgi:hypothetical protein
MHVFNRCRIQRHITTNKMGYVFHLVSAANGRHSIKRLSEAVVYRVDLEMRLMGVLFQLEKSRMKSKMTVVNDAGAASTRQ